MANGNQIFTQAQRDLLTNVLNRIIPQEESLPGAGDLGLAGFVEEAVAQTPHLRRLFTDGLAQIEIDATRRGATGFDELSEHAKDGTLRELESSNPDFFEQLGARRLTATTPTQTYSRNSDTPCQPPSLWDSHRNC